jgi:valyl-tRNA synthetase
VAYVREKHDLVRAGRALRADYGIAPTLKVRYLVKPASAEAAARLLADADSLLVLLKAEAVEIDSGLAPSRAMPSAVSKLGTVYLPLEGVIDVEAEIRRLSKQLEKVRADLQRASAKLENADFVGKAPPEVVERQRARQSELVEEREKLQRLIDTLSRA